MQGLLRDGQPLVRVWITKCDDWRPSDWTDMPREATAVKAASDACVSVPVAAMFVEGFNREILRQGTSLWAIAVPVTVRFDQDLVPGELVTSRAIRLP